MAPATDHRLEESPSIAPGTRDEAERGRGASSPSEIPARGWKDILWRVYENLFEHRVLALAAAMAFYALLAIFPALGALVALYGLIADPAAIGQHVQDLSGVIPAGATDVIREQIQRVAAQGGQTLGFAFLLGLAVSIWSANAGMKALFDALNVVYGEREKRSFLKLNAISLAFTLGSIGFLQLALGAIVVIPVLLGYTNLGPTTEWVVWLGRWPIMLLVVGLALVLVYRFGPSREKPQWRWITWGSATAAVAWLVLSVAFSWYTAHFGSYNKTYGSLGAIIGFMTWLWLSAIIILLGAELDAEMEHQTARDTTTGAPKPLGARGAHVADTVGMARS
ncbi:MAG: YihY/virulence factor BrkB family protein [Xanthobacteraceae bacterium]|jgi:membrane protein